MLAIVDIETLEIDEENREEVYAGVIDNQGPPDGTVILALADGDGVIDSESPPAILVLCTEKYTI